ncbi:uncharacterized protein NEMAJ01_1530 [Nematocida major]|uniref:uncharacterized protein n=1 Tax=Nematocida major TaxID=1912982 RepID=UPI002008B994|nr:uncharacterized protein NEMAJ01_1530 [Nematocida major]KAH9386634.1 hypothetical protein NEMAJ01_1530 [Nematocida major]
MGKNSHAFQEACRLHYTEDRQQKNVCASHMLGVCPRHELKMGLGRTCRKEHPADLSGHAFSQALCRSGACAFQSRRTLSDMDRLKSEIKEVFARTKPARPERESVHFLRALTIFELCGSPLADAVRPKKQKCKECPHYVSSEAERRKVHAAGRVHRAYEKMHAFIERYYAGCGFCQKAGKVPE